MNAEKELQKEIAYLKKLINTHKQSSKVRRPVPTQSHTYSRSQPNLQSKSQYGSHHQFKFQKKSSHHGNRVYKPAESVIQQPAKCKNSPRLARNWQSTSSTISLSNVATSRATSKQNNRVYRPGVSSIPVTDSSKSRTSPGSAILSKKAEKAAKPTASKFRWKRKSLSDDQNGGDSGPSTTPKGKGLRVTPKRPGSQKNTRYKWRRRSSSGSKDKSARTPISPLIAQSKFKLTRASLLRTSSSPFVCREGTFRQRRLSYRKRHTPLSQRFKSVHSTSLRGKELRKSKNKVWIAEKAEQSSVANPAVGASRDSSKSSNSSHQPALLGREVKTARGNKQWVASSLVGQTRRRSRSGVVLLRGDKYVMDKSGRRLKRLSSSSKLAQALKRRSVSDVVKSPSVKQFLASRAIRKSKLYVWNAKHKDKSKQYCMFFNRFGKCNHRDTCPYIHDPDKIAVCTKFLRGVCEKTDGSCPFSHKISKEKMPVCSFFLRGVCTKDDCPYLHVSVGREAKVCMDFVRGYCPRGEECTMQHVLDCPEFLEKGACPQGKACPLRHRERLYKVRRERAQQSKEAGSTAVVSAVKEPYAFKLAARFCNGGAKSSTLETPDVSPAKTSSTPFDFSTAPDFIAL